MEVFVQTDVGKARPSNEDFYYLPQDGEHFCAIADGMGGHNAGEVASAMAVDVFSEEMRSHRVLSCMAIREAVETANRAIFRESLERAECSGMGTTFTALAQEGRNVRIAHVGDSRAYLIRGDKIMRVTMDHTLVEEMVLQGLITPQEAKHHPKRNYITRALGASEHVEVDVIQLELEPDDVFFLCTDGLSNHVEDQTIYETARREDGWQQKLNALVQLALDNGGTDNITAMFAVFEEDHK